MKSGVGNTAEPDQALLGEFKIQEDVKMYSRRPEYYDFRGFYLNIETYLAAISKRVYGDLRSRRAQLLNATYSVRTSR